MGTVRSELVRSAIAWVIRSVGPIYGAIKSHESITAEGGTVVDAEEGQGGC
jgi:hypothetical protein